MKKKNQIDRVLEYLQNNPNGSIIPAISDQTGIPINSVSRAIKKIEDDLLLPGESIEYARSSGNQFGKYKLVYPLDEVPNLDIEKKSAIKLAQEHVSWERGALESFGIHLDDAVWDLMVDNFVHGYKHGQDYEGG